jgi:hypothetical protein
MLRAGRVIYPGGMPPVASARCRLACALLIATIGAWWPNELAAQGMTGQPQPAADQRYAIEVSLDTARHLVAGHESIHFTNHSKRPVEVLTFHLYLNAFRDSNSVFMREGGGQLRNGVLGHAGRCEITTLRSADGSDLLKGAERELIAGDQTQLRVRLPQPLPPSAALDLELTFRSELPEIVARAGYAGEFHMLGQWFPKLARLEPSAEFASFPYHGLGEFYADFADYTLTVTLPARFQIAAGGVLTASRLHSGQRTDRFVAQRVHDLAWAAYPYFIEHSIRVGRVQVQLFAPRGYTAALERQARLVAAALPYFEQRYGAYPYAKLSVVIPPADAERAAGMEYPTFFVSGGPFWALPAWAPDPQHDVVSIHELAHQWFSGMIASNEVAHPFLDEGLAEWASLDFLRHYYAQPPSWFAAHAPPFQLFDLVAALYARRSATVPSSLLPITGYRYETLARAVYMRPGLVFEASAERFGRARLEAALARYARVQRFGHPTPSDLFEAFDAEFGAGFAQRELEPALAGTREVRVSSARTTAVSARTFSAELLFVAQALLSWLGA